VDKKLWTWKIPQGEMTVMSALDMKPQTRDEGKLLKVKKR